MFEKLAEFPADFNGKVRLFPLPNAVVFPHALQPLRVFEERYQEMFLDALDGDRLIAMAVLRPQWEAEYDGRPPIEPMVCIGSIQTHTEDPHGYNLILLGLRRARLVRELQPLRSFRQAEVEVLSDHYPAQTGSRRPQLHQQIIALFRRHTPPVSAVQEIFEQLASTQTPLGMLTDILAQHVNLDLKLKLALLKETNVDRRAELLIQCLDFPRGTGRVSNQPFPPGFSEN